jgi:putative transposase
MDSLLAKVELRCGCVVEISELSYGFQNLCVKHKKKGGIKEILEETIRGQCEDRKWNVLALEIQPDHIHCFVSVPPKWSISQVANQLKGYTSIVLRRSIFPELKKWLGKSLWADGYYVSTAGFISENKVKRYIEDQIHHLRQQQYQEQFGGRQKTLSQSPPPFPLYPKGQSFHGSY